MLLSMYSSLFGTDNRSTSGGSPEFSNRFSGKWYSDNCYMKYLVLHEVGISSISLTKYDHNQHYGVLTLGRVIAMIRSRCFVQINASSSTPAVLLVHCLWTTEVH